MLKDVRRFGRRPVVARQGPPDPDVPSSPVDQQRVLVRLIVLAVLGLIALLLSTIAG